MTIFAFLARWLGWLLLLAPMAMGQQRGGLEQARERWQNMSPAERARIAERFDEFRHLPEAERQRVMSHLRRVAQARREIEERIPAELKEKLERLDPHERRQVLREYVESAMSERGERLREKLSPELVEKLEDATPAEREELLRTRREEWLQRWAPSVLAKLGRELELPAEEQARLQALPPGEMMAAIEALSRRVIERKGPPPGVSPEEFRGWLELPNRELMERMHCQGKRGSRERGPDQDGARDDPRPRRESRLAPEQHRQVMQALRGEKEWILELADQPYEARREEIRRRARAKVIELLRNEPAVSAEELARLEAATGKDFYEALREITGDPPRRSGDRSRWGPRGGAHPGAPDAPPGDTGERRR